MDMVHLKWLFASVQKVFEMVSQIHGFLKGRFATLFGVISHTEIFTC